MNLLLRITLTIFTLFGVLACGEYNVNCSDNETKKGKITLFKNVNVTCSDNETDDNQSLTYFPPNPLQYIEQL
jgi:hypothetical protein